MAALCGKAATAVQAVHRLGTGPVKTGWSSCHTSSTAARARVTAGRAATAAGPCHQLRIFRFRRLAEEGADIARPWKGHVGDRRALSAEEWHHGEPLLKDFKGAAHLRAVTVERVVGALRRKTHEVNVLAEHWPDEGHLHHHPLDRIEPGDRVLWYCASRAFWIARRRRIAKASQ